VLVPFGVPVGDWEGADLWLSVEDAQWHGLGAGSGHLQARHALVRCAGRGSAARPRRARLWLPAAGAAAAGAAATATVVPIAQREAG
jgi:hypothetical protein